MTARPLSRRIPHPPHAQRGVTLIIALIVLVAMTLAGVAMMRSVDTGTIVAGNIAFRQATVHSADDGLQTGYAFIAANSGGTALYNDDNALGTGSKGYFSSTPSTEPDWMDANTWNRAGVVNAGLPDAAGNVVYYMIHRLCPYPATAPNANVGGNVNICGQTPDNAAISGEGSEQSAPNYFTRPPQTHYRVTARSVGPRNSITIVQTLLRSQ